MSNVIPPLLSSSPPPMVGVLDEDEDDEFGDFTTATNTSYGCEATSIPSSLQKSPKGSLNQSSPNHGSDNNNSKVTPMGIEKDFQDKRKSPITNSETIASASESSVGQDSLSEFNVNSVLYNNEKIKPKADNKFNTFQYFPEIPPDIVSEDEDEFEDVGNGYVGEFDEFHDFSNDNQTAIADEIEIPNADRAHVEPSQKLIEPILNDKIPQLEGANLEPNDTSKNNAFTEVEVDNENITKSDIVEKEMSTTPCEKDLTKIENHSEISTNSNLQQEHNSIEAVPNSQTQVVEETDVNKEGTHDDTFKDAAVAKIENSQIQNDRSTEDKFSESEDDFGDFEAHSEIKVVTAAAAESIAHVPDVDTVISADQGVDNSDSEFGDFEASDEKLQWESDPFSDTKNADTDDNNFGNFDNQLFAEPPLESDTDQEFGDFAEVQSSKSETADNDEFGDFNECPRSAETSQSSSVEVGEDANQLQRSLSVDVESVPQRAQSIILEMFPVIEQAASDYCNEDFITNDVIIKGLGDVTDTCALLYQWSKSNSQHCFLRALNIDTRNILYGPRWNESMPRYAATLGYTPLEPVKSEILTPTPAEPSVATAVASSQPPSGGDTAPPQTDIPSAQFDWVGSGLTNPLENSPASTMLLDLEQLVASLDIQFSSTLTPNKSPNSPSPVNDIDDWEFWLRLTPKKIVEKHHPVVKESKSHDYGILQTTKRKTSEEIDTKPVDVELPPVTQPEISTVLQTHSDSGSVKSLQFNELQPEPDGANKTEDNSTPEFDDFTSFQSSSKREESSNFSNWSFSGIPLRETHISNLQSEPTFTKPDKTGINFDEPGWLKPTILTPDLPRKVSAPREEEEFADFQASEPNASGKNVAAKSKLEDIKPETSINTNSDPEVCANSVSKADDDDDFADFQSTLPNSIVAPALPTPVPPQPLQPAILEPLKPSLLQPTMSSACINWPDPGITDYDLIRIELNYKPKSLNCDSDETVAVNATESNGKPSKQPNPEPTTPPEDDDWSDFVSSQDTPACTPAQSIRSPLHASQFKQPSRTSMPELSLCVPHLNHMQPPRRPVPVITQQGLIQTKLPVEPLVQPSVQQTKTYPQVSQLQNGFQPSLISNQFAAQFGQGLGFPNSQQNRPLSTVDAPKQNRGINHLHQDLYNSSNMSPCFAASQSVKPPQSSVGSSCKTMDDFDDEWTDFVSSQPAPPVVQSVAPSAISNGVHGHPPKINFDWNRPPQFTSWSANVTPNIITNPVSFDSFQSYNSPAQTDLLKNRTSNRKNPNVVIQPKKNTIPSISSVPDLEFIAPKSRTWKK